MFSFFFLFFLQVKHDAFLVSDLMLKVENCQLQLL